jgi:hypothetical protein
VSTPGPDPEAAYYQAVEDYFVARRGDPLILSNADWNLVRRWRVAGVPLRVVLRGIRDAFDAHALGWSRNRKVGSLAYCEREVEAARERWQRALGSGVAEGAAAGALAAALEQAAGLGAAARPLAREIARGLRERMGGCGLAELSTWLVEHEKLLLQAIAREEPEAMRLEREREVDQALLPWRGRMPQKVLQQLRSESIARRTLEAYCLPRLSLFHLEGGGGLDP